MAYTLTQARPLLTAAELELFEQSRTEPVKRLTPAALASAVKRTRTLRDKSRDLYRRQTVSVRTDTPGAVTGDDNQRTQRKADILQEVLERYEARATLLSERGDSNSKGKTGGKASAKTSDKGSASSDKVTAKAGAEPRSMKKDSSAAPAKTAKTAKTAKAAAAAPAAKADVKTIKASKQASAEQASDKVSKPAKAAASGKKSSASAQPSTLGSAGAGMSPDTDSGAAPKPVKAGSAPARSPKAPSRKAPTANNKASAPNVNAPLDTLPSSKRTSPLKTDPTNTAIQAHQSSQGRRAQGKRDSR